MINDELKNKFICSCHGSDSKDSDGFDSSERQLDAFNDAGRGGGILRWGKLAI